MFKKISLTFYAVIAFTVCKVQAQNKLKKDSSTVIIFNSGGSEKKISKGSSEENVIKIEPLGFLSGKLPISFERKITDLISIQLTAGVTTKNYLRSAILTGLTDSESGFDGDVIYEDPKISSDFTDQSEALYKYETRKAKVGYMFSFQPRFHFNNDGIEGSYIAVSADFYKYNFTVPGLANANGSVKNTVATKNEYENIKDIMVFFGYQTLYDRLSLEYSAGAGIRSVNGVKYVAGNIDNTFYEAESAYSKKTGINLGISFKVGYHF